MSSEKIHKNSLTERKFVVKESEYKPELIRQIWIDAELM